NGTTNTLTVTYTYDVEGQRVAEQDWATGGTTTTTHFVWDGQNVMADLDGSNTPLVRYLTGDGENQVLTRTVASGANAGVSEYFTDNLGSIRDIASSGGVLLDHREYAGFGTVTDTNAAVADRIGWDGYQTTQITTALDFTDNRVYDPGSG